MHWDTVIQHAQIRPSKVNDPLARSILYVRIANVPFARHDPVEYSGPCWNLVHGQIDMASEQAQRLSHAVPGDASDDRKDFRSQRINILANSCTVELPRYRVLSHYAPFAVGQYHVAKSDPCQPDCFRSNALTSSHQQAAFAHYARVPARERAVPHEAGEYNE